MCGHVQPRLRKVQAKIRSWLGRPAQTIFPWKPSFAHRELILELCETVFQIPAAAINEKEEEFAT